MSRSVLEKLEEQLNQLLAESAESVPEQAVYNINAAMALAGILEGRGFTFKLKDMCPKSPTETNWRATFLKADKVFSVQNPQSSVAVCMAAVDALS